MIRRLLIVAASLAHLNCSGGALAPRVAHDATAPRSGVTHWDGCLGLVYAEGPVTVMDPARPGRTLTIPAGAVAAWGEPVDIEVEVN